MSESGVPVAPARTSAVAPNADLHGFDGNKDYLERTGQDGEKNAFTGRSDVSRQQDRAGLRDTRGVPANNAPHTAVSATARPGIDSGVIHAGAMHHAAYHRDGERLRPPDYQGPAIPILATGVSQGHVGISLDGSGAIAATHAPLGRGAPHILIIDMFGPLYSMLYARDGRPAITTEHLRAALNSAGLDASTFSETRLAIALAEAERTIRYRYQGRYFGKNGLAPTWAIWLEHHRVAFGQLGLFRADLGELLERHVQGSDVPVRLRTHVRDGLATLQRRGYRLAVLAQTLMPKRCRSLLAQHGLSKYFDAVVMSSEVAAWKPSPQLFAKACDLMGATPQACAYVGMDATLDLLPAAHAGLLPVTHTTMDALLAAFPGIAGRVRPTHSLRQLASH